MHRRAARAAIAGACALALVAAACGGDDDDDGAEEPAPTEAPSTEPGATDAPGTTAAPGTTGAPSTDTGGTTPTGSAGCPAIDDSIDETEGVGAGRFLSDLACGIANPLAAEGEPIVIGFQNPEGDPNGSFPEASLATEAAVEFINTELGGWGSDLQNGVPGRPIELRVCKTAIAPDDSQRCANELVAEDPDLVIATINFFGNHLPIFEAAGIPTFVTSPVTIGDFTSQNAYAISGGGGCLGQHTALVEFATSDLEGTRIAVPWADTPPGVVCYYDLEAKPLDVIKGVVEGTAARAGEVPDLEHIGIPVKPATPDVTPQVTQILDFDPNVIIFSAQGADCWNLVDGLGRLGWTPDSIPLVLSGACIDFDAMRAAGDLANGIYFVTAGGSTTNELDAIENPRERAEAEVFQTKPLEYGLSETDLYKGFGANGFSSMMGLWGLSVRVAASGEEVTGDALRTYVAATENDHMFGTTPLSCASAPEPYVAICNSINTVTQWDGTNLVPVREDFSGADLVAGTELKPGP